MNFSNHLKNMYKTYVTAFFSRPTHFLCKSGKFKQKYKLNLSMSVILSTYVIYNYNTCINGDGS